MNIHEIEKELGLRKVDNTMYKGVVSSGDFHGCCDYNVGLLTLIICKPESGNFTHSYVVAIFTIDDDSWMGFSQDGNFDIDELANEFSETFGTKLPNETHLNEFLAKYKIYGHNAG